MERLKIVGGGIVGTIAPLVGAVVSSAEHVAEWLKITSLLVGIVVAGMSGWGIWRTTRAKVLRDEMEAQLARVRAQREAEELCAACRAGTPPPECPWPSEQRPKECRRHRATP